MSANTTAAGVPAAASSAQAAAPAAASRVKVPIGAITYHTVIVLLALVALIVLLRIPRLFARFWRLSEWTRGHILGYKPHSAVSSRISFRGPDAGDFDAFSKELGSSDSSHEAKFAAPRRVRTTQGSYAPHLEPAPSFLRPVVSVLRSRLAPGVSAVQVLVCAGYLGILLYPSIYRSTGPFIDYNRFGYISTSQIPFVFALGTKNNVLGMFLGLGYEKLNFLHRFVAKLCIIAAHIHGVGYVYKWCIAQTFMEAISKPKNYYGLLALFCFDGLYLFSTAYVRKNAYNLFFYSHVVFFQALVVSSFYHYPEMLPYLYCTCAIYGLDKLMRFAKTRMTTANIRAIPELGVTRIEMPYINKGWRAGQHVRLQVFSGAMGLLGWAQVHPFTIASASNSNEGLVLMCKKTGTWTTKLYATAAESRTERGMGRNVRVVVEGPYGGPGLVMFNSFSAAVFVAGGSGITFALSALQELIQQDLRGESRVRVIELIWVIPDPTSLVPMIPQFTALIEQSAYAQLTISVHYTKAVAGNMRINNGVHPGLSLAAGRPRLINAFEATAARAGSAGRGEQCGMIVGVCGPTGLGDEVSKAVGLVDPVKRDDIGGIEIHEEVFGW